MRVVNVKVIFPNNLLNIHIGRKRTLKMSNQELVPRKNMTDEERLELAARLDADLENFIDGLEKKRYEDGWPEDRWEEVCTYFY